MSTSHTGDQSPSPLAAGRAGDRPRRCAVERRFARDAARVAEQASRETPRALFYVHVERQREIAERCGTDAEHALNSVIERRLDEALGSTIARCHSSVDDYAILKDRCGREEASAMAHRICAAIERETFVWQAATFRLGVSVGVLELDERPQRVDDLLDRAEDACSVARSLGNDGVVVLDSRPGQRESVARVQDWREHLSEILG